jgi:hypothetical protein
MLKLSQENVTMFLSYNGRNWNGACVVVNGTTQVHEIKRFIPSNSKEEPQYFFHEICEIFGIDSDPESPVAARVHERQGFILQELEILSNPEQRLEIFDVLTFNHGVEGISGESIEDGARECLHQHFSNVDWIENTRDIEHLPDIQYSNGGDTYTQTALYVSEHSVYIDQNEDRDDWDMSYLYGVGISTYGDVVETLENAYIKAAMIAAVSNCRDLLSEYGIVITDLNSDDLVSMLVSAESFAYLPAALQSWYATAKEEYASLYRISIHTCLDILNELPALKDLEDEENAE